MASYGVHLERHEENLDEIASLQARYGSPVGVGGVLDHLNRQATGARVPGRGLTWGFTWNPQDGDSQRWWPQGISTSADASDTEDFEGRRLIVTSPYSKGEKDDNHGSRVTFVDVDRLRYRHVLIVRAGIDLLGRATLEPLRIHAGGVVWCGPYLHLAGTRHGLFTCHVDDILRGGARQRHLRLPLRAPGAVRLRRALRGVGRGAALLVPVARPRGVAAGAGRRGVRHRRA